jgi:hypothetical protein
MESKRTECRAEDYKSRKTEGERKRVKESKHEEQDRVEPVNGRGARGEKTAIEGETR